MREKLKVFDDNSEKITQTLGFTDDESDKIHEEVMEDVFSNKAITELMKEYSELYNLQEYTLRVYYLGSLKTKIAIKLHNLLG